MMSTTRKVYLATIITLLASLLLPAWVLAQSPDTGFPDGFYLIASAPGVELYRKDYTGGSPDFVQVVDLSQGARIVSMHGEVHELRPGKGAYGGNDARIMSQSLQKYWKQLKSEYGEAFCALNGQFFFMQESPTRLPFPLKVNGEIVTDGYGINEFPDNKLILELWTDKASISPLDSNSLYNSNAPDVIGGLTQTANKRSDRYVGRTFVGIDDTNQDGSAETVLIFNSSLSRQVDAASVLQDFGADQVMMFDGGGSTQLICQGEALISSDRPIPQAFGIIAGSTQPQSQSNELNPAAGDNFAPLPNYATEVSPAEDQPPAPTEIESVSPVGQSTPPLVSLGDVLWVPLMMTPIIAVVFFFVGRLRFG